MYQIWIVLAKLAKQMNYEIVVGGGGGGGGVRGKRRRGEGGGGWEKEEETFYSKCQNQVYKYKTRV